MSVYITTVDMEEIEDCIDCPRHSEHTNKCFVLEKDVEPQGIDPRCPYLEKQETNEVKK